MSRLVSKALGELERLPDAEQETIAATILEALADERHWQASLARSVELLANLASHGGSADELSTDAGAAH